MTLHTQVELSEQMLQCLLEAMPDVVVTCDSQERQGECNRQARP